MPEAVIVATGRTPIGRANKGSLTAGKLADFVIIDRDLFAIPATQLKDAKVLLTVVGGRITHAAAPFQR